MGLKLNAVTGGGSIALNPPNSTTSNADVVLTLPANDGDASQYLQTDGAGALSWDTLTVAFESYALINDTKASTTDGGTFTSGGWRTRDLNTELDDPDGIVSISSNQFTLGAGSYLIRWSAPGYSVNTHQTRLYDVTNTAARALGSSEYAPASTFVQNRSFGFDRVTIAASTAYEIQHYSWTTKNTNGFGVGNSTGSWGDLVFAVVEIYKEA